MKSRITQLFGGDKSRAPRVTQELTTTTTATTSCKPAASPAKVAPKATASGTATPTTSSAGSTPPALASPPPELDRFWAASIRLFQVDVLVVHVWMSLLRDHEERERLIQIFEARFARPIVLAAVTKSGLAKYYGPGPIAQVLSRIPFSALAWRRYRFSTPKPQMLPIPAEPPRDELAESSREDEGSDYSYVATVPRDRDQEETRP